MKTIKLEDKEFKPYISEEEILDAVDKVAQQINGDFEGEEVIFLSVLNGSFMFTSDLVKKIRLKCRITFTKLSSYQDTSSTGVVKSLIGLHESLENKNVIIIEDIVDTGLTLQKLLELLKDHKPKTLSVASLLYKPESYKGSHKLDYTGIEIPSKFIVGYGLDYNGLGRHFGAIYQIVNH
jgi:hypoxanthine phosphoribosyltransferase